jgi:hypothetical protein
LGAVEDHEAPVLTRQEVAGRQTGLASADDGNVEALGRTG